MNAQTVVDTFAPFVGTEGLRGITKVELEGLHLVRVMWRGRNYSEYMHPVAAHGFLLSRLAEGLLLSESHWILCQDEGGVRAGENEGYRDVVEPDYPSAILAAARVEWPKREDREQPTIPRRMVFEGCFRCDEYHTEADGTIVVTKATITEGSVSYP